MMTVFGVGLEDLMRRVPPHPGAWRGVLAAERYLLDMERLKTEPGTTAEELPAITQGLLALASDAD